ncbi:hypothetical protein [Halofilum ochraceum]|uniref:hypothetical protein n=1 Tax=Halofilum ochraceum TaxID=1611323 RepID=UPI000832A503|nr:hypothetical protein [Halofilum ochraceum]
MAEFIGGLAGMLIFSLLLHYLLEGLVTGSTARARSFRRKAIIVVMATVAVSGSFSADTNISYIAAYWATVIILAIYHQSQGKSPLARDRPANSRSGPRT